jgi:hypothetical protein
MVKFIPKPTLFSAIAIAQKVLSNEQVRKRLVAAPGIVIEWAQQQRALRREANRRGLSDPTSRFGQKSLERRVESLAVVVVRAFPNYDDPARNDLLKAIEGLRVALAIAKPMPGTAH